MECISCQNEFELEEVLITSKFCWPELNMVWHECSECNFGQHLVIQNNLIQVIDNYLPMEPNWDVVQEIKVSNLVTRSDPKYLHFWYDEKHFEILAK